MRSRKISTYDSRVLSQIGETEERRDKAHKARNRAENHKGHTPCCGPLGDSPHGMKRLPQE